MLSEGVRPRTNRAGALSGAVRGPAPRVAVMPARIAADQPARWGRLATIDLYACDPAALADPVAIRAFVGAVVPAIGMEAHGPTHLERFGEGELEGWSAMQFIRTSSIVVHADEHGCRCFVDVFSCKAFDPNVVAGVAELCFGGVASIRVIER